MEPSTVGPSSVERSTGKVPQGGGRFGVCHTSTLAHPATPQTRAYVLCHVRLNENEASGARPTSGNSIRWLPRLQVDTAAQDDRLLIVGARLRE